MTKTTNTYITYGYKVMMNKESSHNLFRFLMCRDVNMRKLEGIFYDYSCGLDPYTLNRDPLEFQYKRMLVDGAHWASQKKLKKPNQTGSGGHIGCSDSFNYNIYREHLKIDFDFNSQGREQLHSKIDACCKSLRLLSYSNYMRFLYVFFGVTNLKNRGFN